MSEEQGQPEIVDNTSTDVSNAVTHQTNGKFAPGNKLGHGNPHAKRVAELKSACLEAVTGDDLSRVIRKLVQMASEGDVPAAKVLLDRLFGKEVICTIQGGQGGALMQVLLLPRNGTESDRDRPPG